MSYQGAEAGLYGQGSSSASSALEDQRLEASSATKKDAFADKGGVLPKNRMIFPLDFVLVLCPLLFCLSRNIDSHLRPMFITWCHVSGSRVLYGLLIRSNYHIKEKQVKANPFTWQKPGLAFGQYF